MWHVMGCCFALIFFSELPPKCLPEVHCFEGINMVREVVLRGSYDIAQKSFFELFLKSSFIVDSHVGMCVVLNCCCYSSCLYRVW